MQSVRDLCQDRSPLWGGHLLQVQGFLQAKSSSSGIKIFLSRLFLVKFILYQCTFKKKSSFSFNPGESPRGRQIARARRKEPASSTSRWKNIALGVVYRNVSGTKLGLSQDVCVGVIVHGPIFAGWG